MDAVVLEWAKPTWVCKSGHRKKPLLPTATLPSSTAASMTNTTRLSSCPQGARGPLSCLYGLWTPEKVLTELLSRESTEKNVPCWPKPTPSSGPQLCRQSVWRATKFLMFKVHQIDYSLDHMMIRSCRLQPCTVLGCASRETEDSWAPLPYSLDEDKEQSQKMEPPSPEKSKFSGHTAEGGKSGHTHSSGHIQGSPVTFSYFHSRVNFRTPTRVAAWTVKMCFELF